MKATLLLLALGFTLARTAAAQTFALNPSADAFVSAANPTSNYGAAGALGISATTATNGEFDTVMQFALSGSTSGLSIQSIKLQLTATAPNNPIFNSQESGSFSVIWMDNSSWTEGNGTPSTASTTGGITYDTLPNYLDSGDESLGTFSFNAATSGTTGAVSSFTLQLPSGFLNDVTSGGVVSLELVPDDANVSYLFNSVNFGTSSKRPLLTVTAVPEPASWWLAALGLPLVALARRQPRKA